MKTAIVLFRKSIRIHDNPVLAWAETSQEIDSIIPIYIMDDKWSPEKGSILSLSRLNFLYDSLLDLDKNLEQNYGSKLLVFSGDSKNIIESIIKSLDGGINMLLCDYCSEPRSRKEISKIKLNFIFSSPNMGTYNCKSTNKT